MEQQPTAPSRRPSRRERPAKAALSREGIVAVALAIMRAEGLAKITMRRIAAALDTGPASLYVYVRDTEDLHAQLLDALLADVVVPEAGDWRQRLKGLIRRYIDLLFAYPEMARMALSTPANGPNYLRLVETLLGLMHEGGIEDGAAALAVDMLLLYATADAAEHANWQQTPRAARDMAELSASLAAADPAEFPHIARLGPALLSGGPELRLDWTLDVMLAGALATPRPPPR
jgi:AcrR family transcriptional regulator